MQQVFSELKSINLNTEDMNTLPASITDGMQLNEAEIQVGKDATQTDENLTTINLDNNEIIISELLLQYEDSSQKGISNDNCIQLIKQHIRFKSKNKDEIFNYY